MSTNEAKNRTQTLPYLNALLTHPTSCHNPKNTQGNSLLAPTPKKRLHTHEHKYAQHNPPCLEQQPATKRQHALRCINKTVCHALPKQTNKRSNKLTKRTKV
jgi:hypothetical protein